MVFSLKNIDDAGFGLRDSSKLGNLLHRKWRENHEQAELVNVWGSCGHVFVTTNKGRNLHAFESVPRSKWTPESEGLLLQDQESPIVSVLSSTENPSLIFIVHQNSITESWEFTQSNYKWIKRNEFQLSNTKGVEVLHVILHPLVNSFFWCERRSSSASNLTTCCVCLREVTVSERLGNNTAVSVGPLVAILHGCPSMSLHVLGRSVGMVPDFPEELKNIILFWTFIQRSLKIYLWNYGFVGDVEKFDFKAIIAELVCPWISSAKSDKSPIVAVTSHPTTNELLVLSSDSELSYFKLQDGSPVLKSLVTLQLDSLLHHDKISVLFAFGLFAGLVWNSGIISIYDIHSGVQICKLEDLQGQNVHVWRCFQLVNSVGFWSISGIWKLQSGTVLEISECVRSSLHSVDFETGRANSSLIRGKSKDVHARTHLLNSGHLFTNDPSLELKNASENFVIPELVCDQETTSESSLMKKETSHTDKRVFAGPLCAANHLIKWNVSHRAAKLALDSIVCSQILSDGSITDEEVPGVFLDLLAGEHAQSPAMALALLWEHPIHREFILHKLEQYMVKSSDKSKTKKTCLNELLHPYLSEFLLLSKQSKLMSDSSFKDITQSPLLPTNSVSQEVASLLEAFDNGPLDMTSLERLSTLSNQHPQQVLDCVAMYLRIDSDQDDLKDSPCEQRWKQIYRLEWRNGHWQRSRVVVRDPFNAILSILLRLFHDSKSEWLMRSVEKGMDIVHLEESDERAEEHVTQSVLECLPVLHTSDANTASILVHSQLYYSTGQETQALHLLLSSHMWKEAIDFVSTCGKNSDNQTLLFVMLTKGLQRGRAPSERLVEALSLKPEGFSTYELLAIIRDQGPVAKDPFSKAAGQISVGEVWPFLDALFSL